MQLPLIVILGPTASGKTGYAIELAKRVDGEIICADSRTVYCDMSIGTAKPTVEEQDGVPHWGLDLVNPDERFTLYDFQQYARVKIAEIRGRNHVPMLVGGSGLYIDSVIYNYALDCESEIDVARRAELEKMSVIELKNYAIKLGVTLPVDTQNKRRLIRAIERGGVNKKCSQLIDNTVVIGITTDKEQLRQRSVLRSKQMLDDGLINETVTLIKRYGAVEPLRRNAYGVVQRYLTGEVPGVELVSMMVQSDMKLIKKQLTWWRKPRRATDIMWRTLDDLKSQLSHTASSELIDEIISEYKEFRQQGK